MVGTAASFNESCTCHEAGSRTRCMTWNGSSARPTRGPRTWSAEILPQANFKLRRYPIQIAASGARSKAGSSTDIISGNPGMPE